MQRLPTGRTSGPLGRARPLDLTPQCWDAGVPTLPKPGMDRVVGQGHAGSQTPSALAGQWGACARPEQSGAGLPGFPFSPYTQGCLSSTLQNVNLVPPFCTGKFRFRLWTSFLCLPWEHCKSSAERAGHTGGGGDLGHRPLTPPTVLALTALPGVSARTLAVGSLWAEGIGQPHSSRAQLE